MANTHEPPTPRRSQARVPRSGEVPYCAFKDDRARLHALISRDIRIVLTTLVLALSGVFGASRLPIGAWLAELFS